MPQINTVLSLFWGIEGGRMALDRIGVKPKLYLSSEIDPNPIANTKHNYPDIVHVGSVTDIYYEPEYGLVCNDNLNISIQTVIDLLIAWSPCQDVSNAGKQAGLAPTMEEYQSRKEAGTATRSDLFWEFIRLRAETKPLYFMLENVKMKKEYMEIFNKAIGFEPVLIDAALLWPQHRKRLYWIGKRNSDGTYSRVDIEQPEDAGMKLKDILHDIPFDAVDAKGKPIWKPVPEKYIPLIKEREKALCITATYSRACPQDYFGNSMRQLVVGQWRRSDIRIHADQEKICTLTANMGTVGNNVPFITEQYMWRPLTVRECARCQGIPDSYEFVTAKTNSYKCIGNGWEVRVIAYIFSHLLSA